MEQWSGRVCNIFSCFTATGPATLHFEPGNGIKSMKLLLYEVLVLEMWIHTVCLTSFLCQQNVQTLSNINIQVSLHVYACQLRLGKDGKGA